MLKVDNNNLKIIFKQSKFSKKKKHLFLKFWKLEVVYFCTVKTFFQFSKIWGRCRAMEDNQTTFF